MCLTKKCLLQRKLEQGTEHPIDDDKDETAGSLNGDTCDGHVWNLSVHIYDPCPNDTWYNYRMKWYLFTQSASIRVLQKDFNKLWANYFCNAEKDIHRLSDKQISRYFEFDLLDADPSFKRWFHAIKRSMA